MPHPSFWRDILRVAVALYRPQLNRITGTQFRNLREAYVKGGILTLGAILPAALVIGFAASPLPSRPLLAAAVLVGGTLWVTLLFVLRHALAGEIGRFVETARLPRRAKRLDVTSAGAE